MTSIAGQTVVIARGETPTGCALATRFAREGWRVALLACAHRRETTGHKPCPDLPEVDTSLRWADLTDCDSLEHAASEIEDEFGAIDLWIHNALPETGTVFGVASPTADARRVADLCHQGFLNGTLTALKRMRARRRGHIMHVGPATRFASDPLLQAFFHSLRRDLRRNIRQIRLTRIRVPAAAMAGDESTPHLLLTAEAVADLVYQAAGGRRREVRIRLDGGFPRNESAPAVLASVDPYASAAGS